MSDNNALTPTRPDDYEPEMTPAAEDALLVWQSRHAPAVTSLDISTDAGAQTYLKCLRGSDLKLKECTANPLVIRDWFVHPVKPIVSQDGEVGGNLRLVFVLDDGRTVATRSLAVLDGWRHVVQLGKMRGWAFPLAVKFRSVPTGNGLAYLEIENVAPAATPASRPTKWAK